MRRTRTKSDRESGDSFEVLLQLLFPITLILAFVVITELAALQNTSAGVANAQRHEAIIGLQEQLLLKAVRDVFESESEDLQIAHYEALIPSPDAVIDGALPSDFLATTQKVYERFGTPTRLSRMRRQMRERASQHYEELLNQYSAADPNFANGSLAELADITSENGNKLDSAVAGEMDKLVQRANEPQLTLIGNWIRSDRATKESGERITQAWQAFQNAQPADKQNMSDRFLNLKVLALQERMLSLKAPLQEGAVHAVL